MNKMMVYLAIVCFVTLGWKSGSSARENLDLNRGSPADKNLSDTVQTRANTVVSMFSATGNSNQIPQGKEYEELKEELKALLEEMKRLEKEAEGKIQREILPFIKREIEKLREWLRKYHPEDDELEPIRIHREQYIKKSAFMPLQGSNHHFILHVLSRGRGISFQQSSAMFSLDLKPSF